MSMFVGRVRFVLVLLLVLFPAPVLAWGTLAHRYIMGRAIELLPSQIRPFFESNRQELILRVEDPDLWRVAGWDEEANHFLNFGVDEYGPYPFKALPREYDAAVEKFGMPMLRQHGLLPWRAAEMFGQLRRAFQGIPRNSPYAARNVVLFAAVTAHYLQDAHQPLHATINYDGQGTKQRGIHARFETELFERFQGRLTISASKPKAMVSTRDTAFDILIESYRLVPRLLDAEKLAAGNGSAFDDRYFEAFFLHAKPLMERRIGEAITATASMIIGAWEQAGRPTLSRQPN
jgi:hypothetical protein